MRITEQFKNLLAVPSYHYHPVYGREVARALPRFAPAAVALEIRAGWEQELQWGVANWPTATVSHAGGAFLAFVPGDSIIEAYRLGVAAGLSIFCIDLDLKEPISRPGSISLPDPAFAPRVGAAFLQANDALTAEAGPPAPGDLAREAHMATRLDALMRRFPRVLWVGGMAHWSRIRQRLETREFDGPALSTAGPPREWRRMRLGASALHRMTNRLPFQIAQFARQPARYTDADCLQKLALAAVKPENFRATEVAAMLRYARNLIAQESVAETPGLWDLLLSSSAMLGNEYAARLAGVALRERHGEATVNLPQLSYEIGEMPDGRFMGFYKCEDTVLSGEPLLEPPRSITYRRLPTPDEIRRRSRNNPAAEAVPSENGERLNWAAPPDEMASYEAFVRYVLEQAGRADSGETTAIPLVSGTGEGIDVRATIRNWHSGEIYVREPERGNVHITNGLIDYSARTEQDRLNSNCKGWANPDCQNVGSASAQKRAHAVLQEKPFWIQRMYRELSLITLDAPTWVKDSNKLSFYDQVILPLVQQRDADVNLYDWLRIMFAFCRNKPFAYCSRYRPSARIHALARHFRIRVVHVPLRRIAKKLLDRHESFRYMSLTRRQWDAYLMELRESQRAWIPPNAGLDGSAG